MNAVSFSFGAVDGASVVAIPAGFWIPGAQPTAPSPPSPPSPPLSTAIESLIAARAQSRRRPIYLKGLRHFLTPFAAGMSDAPIASITTEAIEGWVAKGRADWSRATRLSRLSTLFSFAKRRGWIRENPCDRIDRIAIDHQPPAILTPTKAAELLEFVSHHEPAALAWFALGMFAGIRPSECDRMTWEAIRGECAVVDAAASKVRRRRVVPMMPAAVDWLKFAKARGARLPIPQVTRRKAMRRVRDALGMRSWPPDILRHTAASYLVASHEDVGKVANWLGNSPSVLLRHYREIVTPDAAAAFWAIRPFVPPS